MTALRLQQMKASQERIAMLTAYDHPFALLLDEAGVDVLLVGDTLGAVVQGHSNTLSVTLDEMVYPARMVTRATRRALIVGRKAPGRRGRLIADARAVAEAGAFAIVLEGIPMDLAAEITSARRIPTIGIGAGLHCDGQVLVLHDWIGMTTRRPRFARAYARVADEVTGAASAFVKDVRAGTFPSDAESRSAHPRVPVSERAGVEGRHP